MHSEIPSQELITETLANTAQTSTRRGPRILGKLRFWWSWFVAGALLLILAPPILLVARLANKPDWVYPWADFGARTWLRLSGVKVDVKGLELLDPKQPFVPIAFKNSDQLMGKGTGEAWPGTIDMVIFSPVETGWVSNDEDLQRLVD